jgi:NADH dehydrogenase/NADH:ubiquinone oxidoreductase subunit G
MGLGMESGEVSAIRIVIDGKEASGPEGQTILEAAAKIGIEIPTLCYSPDFHSSGVCRICVVEVEGSRTLVGACHTPITPGMVIRTHTPNVLMARRAMVELLQAGHDSVCVTDPDCQRCALHKLCSDLQVKPSGFRVRQRRHYPVEEISPYIHRDLSKCILCRRCVQACNDIAGMHIFAIGYRGFTSKVVVDGDVPLDKEACRDCGICIDYCPTNALRRPGEKEAFIEADAA